MDNNEELEQVLSLYNYTFDDFKAMFEEEYLYQLTVCSSIEEAVDQCFFERRKRGGMVTWL